MTENEIKKNKVNRSSAYPVMSLKEAITSIQMIKDKLGKDKYSRQNMVNALGYAKDGGEGARKVAALAHYGLVKRGGNVYSYEEIADQILSPKSDDEKKHALLKVIKNPKLFNGLIKRYNGQALPNMLDNILTREFNINENITKKVAKIFIESVEFAGIYKNGIIQSQKIENLNENNNNDNQDKEQSETQEIISSEIDKSKRATIDSEENKSLELPCGIIIFYPKKLDYNFAIGDFSDVIKKLNEEIKKKLNE
jgi:hypothetical protein